MTLATPSAFVPLPSSASLPEPDGELTVAGQITRDYLKRYEQRRQAGLHNGPPLKGLRMYLYQWHMDRDASNRASQQRSVFYETSGAAGVQTAPAAADGGGADAE